MSKWGQPIFQSIISTPSQAFKKVIQTKKSFKLKQHRNKVEIYWRCTCTHCLLAGIDHFGEQKWNLARPVGFWLPVWELPHPKTLCWFNWSKAGLLIFPTGFLYIMMRHWRSTTQLKQITQQTQQWRSIPMSQDVLVSRDPILPKKGRI